MAVIVDVGDTIVVKLGTYCAGQAGINVLHYDVTAKTGASVNLQDIANWFDNEVEDEYKAILANNATWYGVSTQRDRPGPPTVTEVSAQNVGPGAPIWTNAMPTQTSGVITWRTDFAGRSGRGRMYASFPGALANDPITDRPKDDYVTALDALAAVLSTPQVVTVGANTATLSLVVYDRVTGLRKLVTAHRANQKWGTQRSRGNYGAVNPYPPF